MAVTQLTPLAPQSLQTQMSFLANRKSQENEVTSRLHQQKVSTEVLAKVSPIFFCKRIGIGIVDIYDENIGIDIADTI